MLIDKALVQRVLEEKVRPNLLRHGGDIRLQEITDDGYVKVKLTGACSTCPGAQLTLSETVETALKEACPAIKGVVLAAQVSDALINEALAILREHKYAGGKRRDG